MVRAIMLVQCTLIGGESEARVLTSVRTGNWTTASTWTPELMPVAGDTIIIIDGHTVTIDANLSYTGSPIKLNVHGTLRFNGGGARLTIPCNSFVFLSITGKVISQAPGTSGVSQRITICNVDHWQGGPNSTQTGPVMWPFSPLPVELLGFAVTASENEVQVTWSTATELNSSHFVVQRSRDVMDWTAVGEVEAAGNSLQALQYKWLDVQVPDGLWYYRLVQVDLDGSRTTYPMVVVEVRSRLSTLGCSVDPADPRRLRVFAQAMEPSPGNMVIVELASGRALPLGIADLSAGSMDVSLPPLAVGAYALRVLSTGGERNCRFVLGR